jgi:hypothetical protein
MSSKSEDNPEPGRLAVVARRSILEGELTSGRGPMKRISLVAVLVVSLLGAAPALAAKKPRPKAHVAVVQVKAQSCGVYYRYSC